MTDKVVVLLNGGLGNQLYQYALGRSLSIKHDCKLVLDTSIYGSVHNAHPKVSFFRLKNFNIKENIEITNDLSSFELLFLRVLKKINKKNSINLGLLKYFFNNKFKKIFIDYDFDVSSFSYDFDELKDDDRDHNINILEISDTNSLYHGSWQSIDYFDNIRDFLLIEFDQPEELKEKIFHIKKNIIKENSVAIHIRAEEDSIRDNHIYLEDNFYLKSINHFKKKYDRIVLNVMTDDVKLAKDQISRILNADDEVIFFSDYNLNDLEEFYLFKQHKNFIISKSSFSWWASYLSEENEKDIVLPETWYDGKKTSRHRIANKMRVIID